MYVKEFMVEKVIMFKFILFQEDYQINLKKVILKVEILYYELKFQFLDWRSGSDFSLWWIRIRIFVVMDPDPTFHCNGSGCEPNHLTCKKLKTCPQIFFFGFWITIISKKNLFRDRFCYLNKEIYKHFQFLQQLYSNVLGIFLKTTFERV